MLVDPQAMVAPLLKACPGSKAITTCKCGQVIHGLAAIDEKGSFVHPDGCPATPRTGKKDARNAAISLAMTTGAV